MNRSTTKLFLALRLTLSISVVVLFLSCSGTKGGRVIPERLLGQDLVEIESRLERLVERGQDQYLYRLGEVYFLQTKYRDSYDAYQRADALGQLTDARHRRNFVHSGKALGFSTPYDDDSGYFDRSMVFPVKINPFCGNSRNEDIVPYQWGEYLFVTSSRQQSGDSYPVTGKPFLNVVAFVENCQAVSLPGILPQELNTDLHDGPLAISKDGGLVVINRNYRKPNKENFRHLFFDYYFRDESGRWSGASRFPHCDIDYSVQHPFFKDDEQALYYSSDKPGGYGGFDLYKSVWDGSNWSDPVNLGSEINTVYDEVFPVFTLDGHLSYSSNHPETYGGLDFVLYKSGKRMLYPSPLNTVYDDFALTFSDATSGYLASTRDRGAFTDNIFRFSIHDPGCKDYLVKVRDKSTKEPIEGVLVRYNALELSRRDQLVTLDGGRSFMFCNPDELKWPVEFNAEKQGYNPVSVSQGFEYLPEEGIYLAILEMEGPVELFPPSPDHIASGNIVVYFENDIPRPAAVIPSYESTYDRYVGVRSEYLRGTINPRDVMDRFFREVDLGMSSLRDFAAYVYDNIGDNRIEIFLRGHASPRSNPVYNAALSERRNQSIRNYLMSWDGGKLANYFYRGQISVDAIPFGDTQSAAGVSGSFEDRARSVYSVEASRERRVTLFWNWKDDSLPKGPIPESILRQIEMREGGEGNATPDPQISIDPIELEEELISTGGQGEKWYYIIVSSHPRQEVANREASRIQLAGHIDAGVVSSLDGRNHRVYVKRYTSMQDARRDLGKYRSAISRDVWVHEQ